MADNKPNLAFTARQHDNYRVALINRAREIRAEKLAARPGITEATSVRLSSSQTPPDSPFGRLTTLGPVFLLHARPGVRCGYVVARCSCGAVGCHIIAKMRAGTLQSCGCLIADVSAKINFKHGKNRHPLYTVWLSMNRRCRDVNEKFYYRYGGRGISVCDEWQNDFMSFYEWAVASGWKKGLSIDREDNDGNYEPGNCRFATQKEQMNNTSCNVNATAFGETKTATEWSRDKRCTVTAAGLRARLRRGWSPELAITKPNRLRPALGIELEQTQ